MSEERAIYIRDPKGVPVKARLLRMVRIKPGFEGCGLTINAKGHFSVTELRSGASIGGTSASEKDAIDSARLTVRGRTVEQFRGGIDAVVAMFGELPKIEEAPHD